MDDIEYIQAPDGQILTLQDKITSRVLAYCTLIDHAKSLKEPELMAETMEMLKAIRQSISSSREANISTIKGGRAN